MFDELKYADGRTQTETETPHFDAEYLLNSAVLVRYGNKALLIDGIISQDQIFDFYDEQSEKDIFLRRGKFKNLEYLLFTHCHEDHYDSRNLCRFLKENTGIKVILPSNNGLSQEFIKEAKAHGTDFLLLGGEAGELRKAQIGELKIETVKTGHISFDYPEHYCINLVSQSENILFTADMEMNKLPYLKDFSKKGKSTIFVNHLALLNEDWRQMLKQLEYDRICFYHLPTEKNDNYGYRNLAFQHWNRYKSEFPSAVLLEPETKA